MNNVEQEQDLASASCILDYLTKQDMKSPQFSTTLNALLYSDDYPDFVSSLFRDEHLVFIDFLDMALDAVSTSTSPFLLRKGLRALRKLCGDTQRLPSSHIIPDGLEKTGTAPVAYGGYSDIWKGIYKGNQVAIKTLRRSLRDMESVVNKRFCKEVVIWKRLSHTNVVPFLGISATVSELCMVSEWMPNGDIVSYLKNHHDADRLELLRQVAKGLEYLHSFDVVHGDLKANNIVMNKFGHPRLCDFGLSSITIDSNSVNASSARSGQGTVQWMSPELLIPPDTFDPNSDHPTKASDMYAFAMVVIEVFTENFPFPQTRNEVVIVRILSGQRPRRPEGPLALGLSDNVWDMVQNCWSSEPSRRPPAAEVITCFDDALALLIVNDSGSQTCTATISSSYQTTSVEDLSSSEYSISLLEKAMDPSIVVDMADSQQKKKPHPFTLNFKKYFKKWLS